MWYYLHAHTQLWIVEIFVHNYDIIWTNGQVSLKHRFLLTVVLQFLFHIYVCWMQWKIADFPCILISDSEMDWGCFDVWNIEMTLIESKNCRTMETGGSRQRGRWEWHWDGVAEDTKVLVGPKRLHRSGQYRQRKGGKQLNEWRRTNLKGHRQHRQLQRLRNIHRHYMQQQDQCMDSWNKWCLKRRLKTGKAGRSSPR